MQKHEQKVALFTNYVKLHCTYIYLCKIALKCWCSLCSSFVCNSSNAYKYIVRRRMARHFENMLNSNFIDFAQWKREWEWKWNWARTLRQSNVENELWARASERDRKRERERVIVFFFKGEISIEKNCLRSDDVWLWLNLIFYCCGNVLSDRRSQVWKWVVSPSKITKSCQWHLIAHIIRCEEKNLVHFHFHCEWNSVITTAQKPIQRKILRWLFTLAH